MKKNQGFSFAELLVVIAIISIVSTVMIISFSSLGPSMRLRGGARQIISDLRKVQGWSVEEQNIHQAKFTIDSGTYTLDRVETIPETRETAELPTNVTVSALTPNVVDGEVRFNAAGATLNSSNSPLGEATITIINAQGSTISITISPSGSINSS